MPFSFILTSLRTESLLIHIRSQKLEEDLMVMVMVVMMGSLNVRFKHIEKTNII